MKKRKMIWLTGIVGAAAAALAEGNRFRKRYNRRGDTVKKIVNYYRIFNQWLQIRQAGKSLIPFFTENGYRTVAIYGYKELGERLYDELKESDIEVKYIIDRAADTLYAEIDSYTPDDVLLDVDAVIVTAAHYFDEIEETLRKKMECPIVSIEDVVDSVSSL